MTNDKYPGYTPLKITFAATLTLFNAERYSELTRAELLAISQYGALTGNKFVQTEASFYADRAQR